MFILIVGDRCFFVMDSSATFGIEGLRNMSEKGGA